MSIDTKGVGSLVDLATVLPPLDQIPPRELSGLNVPRDSHSNIVDGFLAERGDGNAVTVTVTESEPANPSPQSPLPARTATISTLSFATAQPQRRVDESPRFTYDPITYYEVASATFTLILESTTLITRADGSTKITFVPYRTTITQPYTQTLTKPTDAPAQAASLSGREEKRQDEAPHDDAPVVVVTDVIVTEVWVTETVTADVPPSPDVVTQLLTATVYPVLESLDPVTQVVTATVYPMPAPVSMEWNPPVPRDERHRAAVAAAAAGAANGDTENTKPKATFGVQRHTPQFLSFWTTCTITISSTIATSTPVPAYTPLTFSSSTSTISTTPSHVPPASTLTTSASELTSLSTYSSSLTTSTNASAPAPSSSAATTTPPSATPTPSTSNAGTVGGGGRGGAALAVTMAALWGLLATVG